VSIDPILTWFSVVSFFLYGGASFVSPTMQREYQRYGLAKFRNLVGTLQVLGAMGLLVGFREPWIGQSASGCLAVMMLVGIGVRVKIKDTVLQTLPAFAYMVLNAYLCLFTY